MKKIIFISSYSLYIFFVTGFFLHTSANPEILNKYTVKYAVFLAGLLILFPFFLWLMWYVLHDSKIKIKKKKYNLKSYQKILIFILIFVTMVFIPLEFYLRDKYANFDSSKYQYSINNYHPFLQLQLTDAYTTNINSAGFRAPEISVKKPENTYRIFVLGGSTVLNMGTTYEKIATSILEKRLQKEYPDKKIEVINAGVDGYTSEHSLIQYLFKIKDYDPDLIIMWHGINDLYYSCSPSDRAYGTFKSDYSHFYSFTGKMVFNHFKIPPVVSVKFVSLDRFRKFITDNWYSDFLNYIKANSKPKEYYTNNTIDQQYEMKDYLSLISYSRNVESLINATKSDEVSLILGNQPSLYKDKMSQDELNKLSFQIYCLKNDKYPTKNSLMNGIEEFNKSTKKIASEKNMPFVDLDSFVPKNLENFMDDVHYTEKGNEAVADALFKYIISLGIIQN